MGKHNSPIEVLASSSLDEGDTDLEYSHYLLTLVEQEEFDNGGVVASLASTRTHSGHVDSYFEELE